MRKKSESQERQPHLTNNEAQTSSLHTVRDLKRRQDREGLAVLLADTQNVSTATRRAAAKALAELGTRQQILALTKALQADPDRGVRVNAAHALGRLGDDAALLALIESLNDREAIVRVEVAQALSRYNSQTAFDLLLQALRASGPENRFMRQYAAEALGKLGDRRAGPALLEALKDESELVRPAVAIALGRLNVIAAIEPLQRAHHNTPHAPGFDCAECKAIDGAIAVLTTKTKDTV